MRSDFVLDHWTSQKTFSIHRDWPFCRYGSPHIFRHAALVRTGSILVAPNVSFGLLDSTSVSVVAWNIVFAAESLCYAIFLRLVYARTTTDFTSAAKVHSTLLVLIFLALLFPALTMHAEDFEVVAYFPALTLGFPAAIYHLCRNWSRLFDIKTCRIVV